MIKKILTAIFLFGPIVSSAAQNDYDGIWDFAFDCAPRAGFYDHSKIDFPASEILNGEGRFTTRDSIRQFTLTVNFREDKVFLNRTAVYLNNYAFNFQLVADATIGKQREFKVEAINWPFGVGLASDCVITGIKRDTHP